MCVCVCVYEKSAIRKNKITNQVLVGSVLYSHAVHLIVAKCAPSELNKTLSGKMSYLPKSDGRPT
jgi:hypothetical protein